MHQARRDYELVLQERFALTEELYKMGEDAAGRARGNSMGSNGTNS